MKTTIKNNDSVKILKSLMKSLRDNANYFDEEHEYERMNELDKVYNVLKRLVPIMKDIIEEKSDSDKFYKFNEDSFKYFAIPRKHCEDLIEMVEYVNEMKPFGEKIES